MAEPQPDKSWLKPFLAPLRPIFYEMLAMSVFINLIALVVPIFSMQVYDRVIPTGNGATLILLTIIICSALLVMSALDVVRSILRRIRKDSFPDDNWYHSHLTCSTC